MHSHLRQRNTHLSSLRMSLLFEGLLCGQIAGQVVVDRKPGNSRRRPRAAIAMETERCLWVHEPWDPEVAAVSGRRWRRPPSFRQPGSQ
jgi:hypothetical protein